VQLQVDPIKSSLNAPGTRRFTLKCIEPLSSFAFNFNLRRYNEDHEGGAHRDSGMHVSPAVIEAGAYTRPLLSST